MYFPYLRGKQYELILLRENAQLVAQHRICPIIEPVRANVSGLSRAMDELTNAGAGFTVIANPSVGDFEGDPSQLVNFLRSVKDEHPGLSLGFLLDAQTGGPDLDLAEEFPDVACCHLGQIEDPELLRLTQESPLIRYNVFFEEHCGRLYRRKFRAASARRVLLRDGFVQRRNADYVEQEHFSDLHATFGDEGMDGFGDYGVVGADWQEGGGPAYAVVIHITYIDADDDMHVCHFKSRTNDSPVDPRGKFSEALDSLVRAIDEGKYPILETGAVEEFRQLHAQGHYPGLGYVKKLSMQHHFETLASFTAET